MAEAAHILAGAGDLRGASLLRPCPADPTDGRSLCHGDEHSWSVDDRCRAPSMYGDAEYVWRTGPDGRVCYTFNP